MDCEKLLSVLGERIKDKQFLNLMRSRLHRYVFDVRSSTYSKVFEGLPQGGIDSPYLWNIYLMGMDDFVKKRMNSLTERT
uniref:Reverse transcriptase family protein n=1 Tax=Haematococcus lacustris TaxID=44745 RepID=A0A2K9YRP0_HAELA|nr:hypothetical protein SG3EUKT975822.1 [Haematococcus lacustris]YP_009463741.1 Reverse transcriptase family protein [Haematococcus lacustris]AUW36494.1 hypothetical protein SG3EUKT975822.1 [Haematococcus lacustris]AUW36563.1 Reverse transcriptase family protein [Haematococcus lacustris]